ncbi:MAG: hypothetical protein WBO23_09100 [Burkholderiales bacterium]
MVASFSTLFPRFAARDLPSGIISFRQEAARVREQSRLSSFRPRHRMVRARVPVGSRSNMNSLRSPLVKTQDKAPLQHAQDRLRLGEAAVLNALPAHTALLDSRCLIVLVSLPLAFFPDRFRPNPA